MGAIKALLPSNLIRVFVLVLSLSLSVFTSCVYTFTSPSVCFTRLDRRGKNLKTQKHTTAVRWHHNLTLSFYILTSCSESTQITAVVTYVIQETRLQTLLVQPAFQNVLRPFESLFTSYFIRLSVVFALFKQTKSSTLLRATPTLQELIISQWTVKSCVNPISFLETWLHISGGEKMPQVIEKNLNRFAPVISGPQLLPKHKAEGLMAAG